MVQTRRRRLVMLGCLSAVLQACGGGGDPGGPGPVPPGPPVPPPPPAGPAVWRGHGGDAQHSARSPAATQALNRILWSTPVDLAPPYRSGALLIHYGSPVITGAGTVIVPVKTTTAGDFRVEARLGSTGGLVWQQTSDYILPTSSWTPSFNLALDANNRLYVPAAGGRLWIREQADSNNGPSKYLAFYGDQIYAANSTALNSQIKINTPLTLDAAGNLYFGFTADAGNAASVTSGIARVSASGVGSWASAATLANDGTITKVAMNCAPALSNDGATLYVAVNGSSASAYLLALDSTTLALKAKQLLRTPVSGAPLAFVTDSSTASPTVGPDGDVFYGVLDMSNATHNARGWLLHFDSTLSTPKTPGSFGWDDTPSIVPASMVSGYTGTSTYLLLSKYNNYYGAGSGDGANRMAILDPQASQSDTIVSTVSVMKEVRTLLGATLDSTAPPPAVREWCVNTAAVDPATNSVLVNNEDGYLYRWDLQAGAWTQRVNMNAGVLQAYTATVSGPSGIVYAVNNAQLHAVGA